MIMDPCQDLEYTTSGSLFIHVLLNPPRPPPRPLPNLTLGGTNLSADMAPVSLSISSLSAPVVLSNVKLRLRILSSASATC
jgi:hypothetical protein